MSRHDEKDDRGTMYHGRLFHTLCNFSPFQPLIAAAGQPRTQTLEQLHQQDQDHHRHQHHQILVAIVAVVDGDLTQTAAADDTAHGGVTQNGSQGNGDVLDQGRHALRDHHLADDLQGV